MPINKPIQGVTYNCLPAALPKTSWIIQQLTHRTTTRVETDGGDKDSAGNPGEIHSTQQPEDSSEYTGHVSFSSVGLLSYHTFQQNHLSLHDGVRTLLLTS